MDSTEKNKRTESSVGDGEGGLRYLGKGDAPFEGFDTFPAPSNIQSVTMTSDEVTSLCPITGQPDWYTVTITYKPRKAEKLGLCLESKSLKLYLQSFRNEALFCEAFAGKIADDVFAALSPISVTVLVEQKPRGGIGIVARAEKSAQQGETHDHIAGEGHLTAQGLE